MIKKLLDRLDSTTKTKILGLNVITELKGVLDPENTGVIDSRLLNDLIERTFLLECYKNLDHFVDVMTTNELHSIGFTNYDKAYRHLKKNKRELAVVWNVDYESLVSAPEGSFLDEEVSFSTYGSQIHSNGSPHPYQFRLKHELLAYINKVRWTNLVSMPTGAGKTRLANEFLVDSFRLNKKFKVLWLVDSKELLNQSLGSFNSLWTEKGDSQVYLQRFFGRYNGVNLDRNKVIVYAGFDLLTSRLDDSSTQKLLASVDLIVIDEAHVSGATTYSKIIETYKEIKADYRVLGLTATPYRLTEDFKQNFGDVLTLRNSKGELLRSPIEYLIKKGYLSDLEFKVLPLEVQEKDRDYQGLLYKCVLSALDEIQKQNKRCVLFAKSRSQAIAMNEYLKFNGIYSDLIIGRVGDSKRDEIISAMKAGKLTVIVNHNILSTGLDIPGLESIMILADIGSPTLALQTLGRAMRGELNGGNAKNSVYLTPSNYQNLKNFDLLEQITLNV